MLSLHRVQGDLVPLFTSLAPKLASQQTFSWDDFMTAVEALCNFEGTGNFHPFLSFATSSSRDPMLPMPCPWVDALHRASVGQRRGRWADFPLFTRAQHPLEALSLRLLSARLHGPPLFGGSCGEKDGSCGEKGGMRPAPAMRTLRRLCADAAAAEPTVTATPPRWDAATDGMTYSWSVTLSSSRRWASLPHSRNVGFLLVADAPFRVCLGPSSSPVVVCVTTAARRQRPPLYAVLTVMPMYIHARVILDARAPEASATLTVHHARDIPSSDIPSDIVAFVPPSPLCRLGCRYSDGVVTTDFCSWQPNGSSSSKSGAELVEVVGDVNPPPILA